MKGRILVVDDEKNITFVLQAMFEREGYEVLSTQDSIQAIEWIEQEDFDVVVTDLFMPKKDGMDVLAAAHLRNSDLPVIMITAFGTVVSAVSALKKGAFDYISKPFDQVELLKVIEKACKTSRARAQESVWDQPSARALAPLLGKSAEAARVNQLVQKIAATDMPVLLLGEMGSGKERVARKIHEGSKRAAGPFIRMSCSAQSPSELRDELFGKSGRPGRFELAFEGTLYLEEFEHLSVDSQSQLLQKIEGDATRVRLIAATDRNLDEEVSQNRIRRDLVTRLSSFSILVPPLRNRGEDLESYCEEFLPLLSQKLSKKVQQIEMLAIAAMKNYSWPGNLRQLQNVLERAVLLAESDTIRMSDLPDELQSKSSESDGSKPSGVQDFKEVVRRKTQALERELIEKALDATQGNVTRAAENLGLSRKGLQLKMKELGLRRF